MVTGGGPPRIGVSPSGAELADLVTALLPTHGRRVLLGLAGPPGAGKSTLAAALGDRLGERAAVVPLDGFHLADVELGRLGLEGRKGAPETFDAWGYAALLRRVRDRPEHTVYAPAFERDLEQPVAGAIPVPASADVVVTEGNYLLLDRPAWRAARGCLDATWFVTVADRLRLSRLGARHVASGKAPPAAEAWVERVDRPNAVLVEADRDRADLVVDVTDWEPDHHHR